MFPAPVRCGPPPEDRAREIDPQHRTVLHPQQFFGGIQANHYPNFATVQAALAGANVFMPTELLHGLYGIPAIGTKFVSPRRPPS